MIRPCIGSLWSPHGHEDMPHWHACIHMSAWHAAWDIYRKICQHSFNSYCSLLSVQRGPWGIHAHESLLQVVVQWRNSWYLHDLSRSHWLAIKGKVKTHSKLTEHCQKHACWKCSIQSTCQSVNNTTIFQEAPKWNALVSKKAWPYLLKLKSSRENSIASRLDSTA